MKHQLESRPPYPGGLTTTKQLYAYLCELHAWANHQIAILVLGAEVKPPPLPKLRRLDSTTYYDQPVMEQFRHFVFMRRLRESYDQIDRDHTGEQWNCEFAMRKRFALLQTAVEQLNDCCRLPEPGEASFGRDMEKLHGVFKHLTTYIDEAITPLWEP